MQTLWGGGEVGEGLVGGRTGKRERALAGGALVKRMRETLLFCVSFSFFSYAFAAVSITEEELRGQREKGGGFSFLLKVAASGGVGGGVSCGIELVQRQDIKEMA